MSNLQIVKTIAENLNAEFAVLTTAGELTGRYKHGFEDTILDENEDVAILLDEDTHVAVSVDVKYAHIVRNINKLNNVTPSEIEIHNNTFFIYQINDDIALNTKFLTTYAFDVNVVSAITVKSNNMAPQNAVDGTTYVPYPEQLYPMVDKYDAVIGSDEFRNRVYNCDESKKLAIGDGWYEFTDILDEFHKYTDKNSIKHIIQFTRMIEEMTFMETNPEKLKEVYAVLTGSTVDVKIEKELDYQTNRQFLFPPDNKLNISDGFKEHVGKDGTITALPKFTKVLNDANIATYIMEELRISKIDGVLHVYHDGIYKMVATDVQQSTIRSAIMKAYKQFGMTSERASKIYKSIVDTATIAERPVKQTHLAFKNGLLNLETKELEEFDPSIVVFTKINANYLGKDAKLVAPTVSETMNIDELFLDMMSNDETKARRLWEIIAYALHYDNVHQKAIILGGTGGNGKSVFLKIIQAIYGGSNSPYTANVAVSDFDGEYLLANWTNQTRINIDDDMATNGGVYSNKSIEMLKKVTSQGTISIGAKFVSQVDYQPTFLHIGATNNLSMSYGDGDSSDALVQRFVMTSFKEEYRDSDKKIINLEEKTQTDAMLSYFVTKAINEYYDIVVEKGFTKTSEDDTLKSKFQENNSTLIEFLLTDEISESKRQEFLDGKMNATSVYKVYEEWASEAGIKNKFRKKNFLQDVTDKGLMKIVEGRSNKKFLQPTQKLLDLIQRKNGGERRIEKAQSTALNLEVMTCEELEQLIKDAKLQLAKKQHQLKMTVGTQKATNA